MARLSLLGPLLSVFALFALAAPVEAAAELKGLTTDNFNSSTAKGLWLVEHFSPYCHHCKQFEPTWRSLTETYEPAEKSFDFHMAQVNCIAQGDLCTANKVKFYPHIKLYQDGVASGEYEGDRSEEHLQSFINGKIAEYTHAKAAVVSEPLTQEIVSRSSAQHADGVVKSLDIDKLDDMAADGPIFVKFYAPWCGHCKKLAPVWTDLASKLKGVLNVAEVNCDEQGRLCKREGINGYPMLFLYNAGHKAEYRGSRKIEALESFATKAVNTGLKMTDLESFPPLLTEKVVFLYLRTISTPKHEVGKVEDAARTLLGDPVVVQSQDPKLWSKLEHSQDEGPILIAFKSGEEVAAAKVEPTTSLELITAWLFQNRLPLSDELTAENFPSIMRSESSPMVVLVALDTENRHEALRERDVATLNGMAKAWLATGRKVDHRPVAFVWMDSAKWGKWLKGMYGVKVSKDPAVIIADHQNLVYYDVGLNGSPIGFSANAVHEALEAIDAGQLKMRYSENLIERTMRSIHNRFEQFEVYFSEHPLRTFGIIAAIISLVVIGLWKLVQLDVQPAKRPRLD